ncbi:MAG: hypothetical protein DWQ01_16300 [Planctomycetota bacterium]|nr:MAG: hypothetical protein DWQ01_16300 [Planctomycetota bacterium]
MSRHSPFTWLWLILSLIAGSRYELWPLGPSVRTGCGCAEQGCTDRQASDCLCQISAAPKASCCEGEASDSTTAKAGYYAGGCRCGHDSEAAQKERRQVWLPGKEVDEGEAVASPEPQVLVKDMNPGDPKAPEPPPPKARLSFFPT